MPRLQCGFSDQNPPFRPPDVADMRRACSPSKMKFEIAMVALLALTGCCQRDSRSLRSLVGDGDLPSLPVAMDETIAIGLPSHARSGGSLVITIEPDGKVSYELQNSFPSYPPSSRTLAVRHVSALDLSRIKDRVAVFRPPDSISDPISILPLGCHWISDDGGPASLAFSRPGQMPRFFHFQTGCKTAASQKLLLYLHKVLGNLPLSPERAMLPTKL